MALQKALFAGDDATPDSVKRRRALADQLLAQGADVSKVDSPMEAIASLLQSGAGAYQRSKADGAEKAGNTARREGLSALASSLLGTPTSPSIGAGAGFGGATGAISDASTPIAATNLKPAEAEGFATKYYVDKGLAPYQAAGLVGNLIQESSLNTGARNPGDGRDGSDSIGIMQANGDRARNLRAFAQGTGRDVGDLTAQLDFTLHEMGLGNPEWQKLPGYGSEARAGNLLKNAKDVTQATAAGISYERPQGWSAANPTAGHGWANRYGHAQRLASGSWGQNAGAAPAPAAPVPVRVASADPSFMPAAAVQQPQAAVAAAPAQAPAPDFLTAGLPATARPVEMPPGPLPEAAQAQTPPVQTAAASPPALAPLPPAQTVGANPVPPGMDDPRFDPRTSPEMRAAMLSGEFDGLGFRSAQAGGNAQGVPSAPQGGAGNPIASALLAGSQPAAAPSGDKRALIAQLMQNPWTEDIGQQLLQQELQNQSRMQQFTAQQQVEQAQLRQKQAYDEQVRQQGYQREDARFSTTDARENERLQLERQRFEREGNKRNVVEIYDEKTGRPQKGYFDDAGSFTPIGGVEAPKNDNGIVIGADGTVQIGGSGKPLTEGQSKDTVYSTRAAGALEILDKYAPSLTSRQDGALGAVPFGLGREYQNTDFQLAQQAGDEFLQAILRKDTGAAISPQEQALYGATYLPQPGDSPELQTQKQLSRSRAIEAIRAGMPASAIVAQELASRRVGDKNAATGQPATTAPASGPAPSPAAPATDEAVPEGVDPKLWKYMPPEDRALWQ